MGGRAMARLCRRWAAFAAIFPTVLGIDASAPVPGAEVGRSTRSAASKRTLMTITGAAKLQGTAAVPASGRTGKPPKTAPLRDNS